LCGLEAELTRQGAHVTRLLAGDLLPGTSLDEPTFRVLGKLYDALIVPHADGVDLSAISAASGVPVLSDDRDGTALEQAPSSSSALAP
jgi:hypothetical protein